MQESRGASVSGLRLGVGLSAGDQDALDGAVGRVADREGFGAGGLQPLVAVLLAQAQDALGGAEPVEGSDFQQRPDDLPAGFAHLPSLGAAPDRCLHLEGDLLRRVVALVGAFALFKCRMCLDQFTVEEDLHHGGGGTDIDAAADQLPGHRVEGAADLDVNVGTDHGS